MYMQIHTWSICHTHNLMHFIAMYMYIVNQDISELELQITVS